MAIGLEPFRILPVCSFRAADSPCVGPCYRHICSVRGRMHEGQRQPKWPQKGSERVSFSALKRRQLQNNQLTLENRVCCASGWGNRQRCKEETRHRNYEPNRSLLSKKLYFCVLIYTHRVTNMFQTNNSEYS